MKTGIHPQIRTRKTDRRCRKLRYSVYALCAAAGFLSAALFPAAATSAAIETTFAAETETETAADTASVNGSAAAPGIILSAPAFAAAQAASGSAFPTADRFTDVDPESWYYPYLDLLVSNGVISGTSDTTFSPDGSFSIAECTAVLTRCLGLEQHASRRQHLLAQSGTAGGGLWYAGYVQTMLDTGIIASGEFGVTGGTDGLAAISEPQQLERPIERDEFALLITRSFDIKTDVVEAKNVPPEICANGNTLITGGRYDDTVSRYAEEISDWDVVAVPARDAVLKAYYNGIFNGDEAGNFNPYAKLTRAEMAKVAAVIIEPSLRTRTEYRTLSEGFSVPQNCYHTDGWGERTINREYAAQMLEKAAESGLRFGTASAEYTPVAAPEGCFIEVRFYSNDGTSYVETAKTEAADSQPVSVEEENLRVLLLLRASGDAKVVGALRAELSDGTVTYDNLFKKMPTA